MKIREAIKQGILHTANEKEQFPIGEVNDYLIAKGIINEKIDFRRIFSIAEPILRELGLKWYGVYGPNGIIVYKPGHIKEKKKEEEEEKWHRKPKGTKEIIEELEKRIEKNGMAYIPENIYESINHYVLHFFDEYLDNIAENGEYLDDIIEKYEQDINEHVRRLRSLFSKAINWNGFGSIREDEEIYRDKWDVLAYILYYFYENYSKIKYILHEGLKRAIKLIPENKVVEILDFGAGPGTVLAGICDFISDAKKVGIYRDTKLNLYFVEENIDFADTCKKMLENVDFAKVWKVDDGIVNNRRRKYFDLVTFSNVLSELKMSYEKRMEYLNKFRAKLKSKGYMIIIEPAYEGQINNLKRLYKDMKGCYGSVCKFPPNYLNYSCLFSKCSIQHKRIKTPEKTTRWVKYNIFEGENKKNIIRYIYAIFRREKEVETGEIELTRDEGYLDPCEVSTRIGEKIDVYGGVVNVGKKGATNKREMIICNGYGGCRLVFWEPEITKSNNISEGEMLYVKNACVNKKYKELYDVRINPDTEVSKEIF
jgi:SAM-dependent methyltransferase